MPTRTINKIHFDDLSFSRFEDMCVQVVYRMRSWSSIQHFGRKGKDRGVDIYTEITEDNVSEKWFVQCKRYEDISISELKRILDDVVLKNKTLPDKYLLVASCDVSRDVFEAFQAYAKSKGVESVDVITSSILETILYSKHPDLLYTFFGVNVFNQRSATVARVKRRLAMKRKIEKEFAGQRKGREVIIRNVHNDSYPEQEWDNPGFYPWYKLEYCRLYHKGISFYSSIVDVHVHQNGSWELPEYKDPLPEGSVKVTAYGMVNIPFDNIVDCDFEGDEYYPFPHIYCEFNNMGQPHEEIWYMPSDKDKTTVFELPKEKMIKKS